MRQLPPQGAASQASHQAKATKQTHPISRRQLRDSQSKHRTNRSRLQLPHTTNSSPSSRLLRHRHRQQRGSLTHTNTQATTQQPHQKTIQGPRPHLISLLTLNTTQNTTISQANLREKCHRPLFRKRHPTTHNHRSQRNTSRQHPRPQEPLLPQLSSHLLPNQRPPLRNTSSRQGPYTNQRNLLQESTNKSNHRARNQLRLRPRPQLMQPHQTTQPTPPPQPSRKQQRHPSPPHNKRTFTPHFIQPPRKLKPHTNKRPFRHNRRRPSNQGKRSTQHTKRKARKHTIHAQGPQPRNPLFKPKDHHPTGPHSQDTRRTKHSNHRGTRLE